MRLRELYKIADEMMAFVQGHVACKRGCAHCCHIGVPLSPIEADMLASDIGRKPKNVKVRDQLSAVTYAESFSYGYTRPCTFLVDGACSIYEHRPLTCRVHYNVDDDEMLCRLDESMPIPVPYLDVSNFKAIYLAITGTKCADIREFFPSPNDRRERDG